MSAAIRHLDTLHPLAALDDATLFIQAAFLGGRWITSETTVAVTDPATGETRPRPRCRPGAPCCRRSGRGSSSAGMT